MVEVEVTSTAKVGVKYLKVEAGVRYWEDAIVNGVEDQSGALIPCRSGDVWKPTIDLETGVIEAWPPGTVASIHYKVADSGFYALLDADRKEVVAIEGYVPKIMSPGDNGYGDYIIMEIDGAGRISKWRVDLSEFEGDDR